MKALTRRLYQGTCAQSAASIKPLLSLYQASMNALSRLYQGYVDPLFRRFKASINALLRLYQGCLKALLRLHEGGIKGVYTAGDRACRGGLSHSSETRRRYAPSLCCLCLPSHLGPARSRRYLCQASVKPLSSLCQASIKPPLSRY